MPEPASTVGPLASSGFHLWHAALAWKDAVGRALEPHGLTPTQFFVLGAITWLARMPQRPRQREVAAMAGLDATTTSQVVRTLERDGRIRRSDDSDDSRAWRVEPTAEGTRQLKAAAVSVRAVERALFGELGAREPELVAMLERVSATARGLAEDRRRP